MPNLRVYTECKSYQNEYPNSFKSFFFHKTLKYLIIFGNLSSSQVLHHNNENTTYCSLDQSVILEWAKIWWFHLWNPAFKIFVLDLAISFYVIDRLVPKKRKKLGFSVINPLGTNRTTVKKEHLFNLCSETYSLFTFVWFCQSWWS